MSRKHRDNYLEEWVQLEEQMEVVEAKEGNQDMILLYRDHISKGC